MQVANLDRSHHGDNEYHARIIGEEEQPPSIVSASTLSDIIGHPAGDRAVLVTGLHDGEPTFTFRAQDALTLGVVRSWYQMAYPTLTPERRQAVERDIQAIVDWRAEHPELIKDPD